MEIERKYLVATFPGHLDDYPCSRIEQGYLCNNPTVRIRRMDERYILTIKQRVSSDSTAVVNREEEFPMTEVSYAQLRSKCDGRLVVKNRYRIPLEDMLIAELDIFHGCHEGLALVEVEFPTIEAADAFCPPSWFGREVSADSRFRNSFLASHSTPPVTK